jgi:hypothetical protein
MSKIRRRKKKTAKFTKRDAKTLIRRGLASSFSKSTIKDIMKAGCKE